MTRLQPHQGRSSPASTPAEPRDEMVVRRCRPLLGTFVEISVAGPPGGPCSERLIDRAFERIERLHHLMSVHNPDSELSRVNAAALSHPVKVSEETFGVLERGLGLARESDGAFDFTVAPTLARWGLLPSHLRRRGTCGNWNDVKLSTGNHVRFDRPLAIDLGGIAKGFAVDAAIDTLQRSELSSAIVNAGGDLRVFGSRFSSIHLRHPARLHSLPSSVPLSDAAMATSSPVVTQNRWRGEEVSHLVDPHRLQAVTGDVSVTVRARECWLADGLTKVVLNNPKRAEALLAKHDAEAFVLTA